MRAKDLGLEAEIAPVGQVWRVYLYHPAGTDDPVRVATVFLDLKTGLRNVKPIYSARALRQKLGFGQGELLAVAEAAVRGFLTAIKMAQEQGFSFDERDE